MSYLNTKSNRAYDFFAPYAEEGERIQRIPFPIAVRREPEGSTLVHDCNPQLPEGSTLVHDCNPQLLEFSASGTAGTISVDTQVQAGSLLIVRNEDTVNAQTVGGVTCAKQTVTTLMWDGTGYITLGSTSLASEEDDE